MPAAAVDKEEGRSGRKPAQAATAEVTLSIFYLVPSRLALAVMPCSCVS